MMNKTNKQTNNKTLNKKVPLKKKNTPPKKKTKKTKTKKTNNNNNNNNKKQQQNIKHRLQIIAKKAHEADIAKCRSSRHVDDISD